jgi:hypothetical protein
MLKANQAFEAGSYWQGLEFVGSALEYVDGMMQHAVKYDSASFSNVPAIEAILKFAPLLLDTNLLDRLQILLREQRRIKRNISEDIDQLISDARTKLDECYRFWRLLESNQNVRQNELSKILGGEQRVWANMAASWERMGLIRRVADGNTCRISIVTQFEEEVQAKCGKCGAISRGMKKSFYEAMTCRNCRKASMLVLVSG